MAQIKRIGAIRAFITLLRWARYRKNAIHPTYKAYLKHAWRLAVEINKDDYDAK